MLHLRSKSTDRRRWESARSLRVCTECQPPGRQSEAILTYSRSPDARLCCSPRRALTRQSYRSRRHPLSSRLSLSLVVLREGRCPLRDRTCKPEVTGRSRSATGWSTGRCASGEECGAHRIERKSLARHSAEEGGEVDQRLTDLRGPRIQARSRLTPYLEVGGHDLLSRAMPSGVGRGRGGLKPVE